MIFKGYDYDENHMLIDSNFPFEDFDWEEDYDNDWDEE